MAKTLTPARPPRGRGRQGVHAGKGIGDGAPGPGRPKGGHNRVTILARTFLNDFVYTNRNVLQECLDGLMRQREYNRASDLYLRAAEYALPKLQRVELSGLDGAPVTLLLDLPGMQQERTIIDQPLDA